MLTLITGQPGAGKTLYAIAELLRPVPGSFIDAEDGSKVERFLHSNINGLCVAHEKIGVEEFQGVREWVQPGAVICFDEAQDAIPHVSSSAKIPDVVNWMSVHRHAGCDVILMTQHPMLLDARVRRLVNRHLHVERMGKTASASVWEWTGCDTALNKKAAAAKKLWRYPKDVFQLYKSSKLHTKPVGRLPAVLWVFLIALAVTAVMGYRFFWHGPLARATQVEQAAAKVRAGEEEPPNADELRRARANARSPFPVPSSAGTPYKLAPSVAELFEGSPPGACAFVPETSSCVCFGEVSGKDIAAACRL